jgi:hypothetical protein
MQDDESDMHSAVATRGRPLHHRRRDSTASVASFYSDVEMSQDEIFAGPTSESLPSSAASFQHRRRSRTDSVTSWSFFQPELDEQEAAAAREREDHDHAVLDEDELTAEMVAEYDRRDSLSLRRKSTAQSATAEEPLLMRHHREAAPAERRPHRTSQTIYIDTEDLTIAVTGFRTSRLGYTIYMALSCLTCGLGWLIFRWFPRAWVRLIGKAAPLGECEWAVVEVRPLVHKWRLCLKMLIAPRRINGMSSLSSKYKSVNTVRRCPRFSGPVKKKPSLSSRRTNLMTTIPSYPTCSVWTTATSDSSITRYMIDSCPIRTGRIRRGTMSRICEQGSMVMRKVIDRRFLGTM